jgi:tRNA threonylcarbamoyladenosine biosynthesis protein TsaE
MEIEVQLSSANDTEEFAKQIGKNLRGSECIEFSSDLGGGKTTFIKGVVRGAGSDDVVNSPTFTIGKKYNTNKLTIYHFDFYRLTEPGLAGEELAEATTDSSGVVLVEWGQSVANVLPKERIIVNLSKVADNAETRICNLNIPLNFNYLIQGLEL